MSKAEMRRQLKAIRERYLEIAESEKPEDRQEVSRLMKEHEFLRLELLDGGGRE